MYIGRNDQNLKKKEVAIAAAAGRIYSSTLSL